MTSRSLRSLAIVCCLALALCARGSQAQQNAARGPGWTSDVDKVFAAFDNKASPGCALALFRNGAIVYERGYGMADLENDIAITPQSVFYVGSLSKQFTAMTAALAIQQGRLKLDDDIHKYIPEMPDYGTPITVRHLIHHTSGVRDINTLLSYAGRRGDEAFDNNDVLRVVVRQKALNFRPGDDYLYSNSGYALLALVVERSTGTPFAQYADANVFNPLGMTVTHFHVDHSRMVKHRAYANTSAPSGELRLDTPVNQRAGAGGIFTNVRELLNWDENFYTGRVGGKELIAQLETPDRLNNGTLLSYAWGLQVGNYRGQPIVEHSGSLGGFRAHLIRFPSQHFSVACLCNVASINPGALVRQVADVNLGDVLTPQQPSAATVPAAAPAPQGQAAQPAAYTAAQLQGFSGTFYSEELDATYAVNVQDGGLTVKRQSGVPTALTASASDEFRMGSILLRFIRSPNGRVDMLSVDAGRVRDIRFVRR